MKLQLEQAEIEKAVQEYVANQGIKVEGKTLTVKFSMTRGEQGLIADLTIDEVKADIKPVTRAPRAGTVGAAIANQSAGQSGKQEAKPAPTTAKEAIEQATAAAAEAAAARTEQTTAVETEEASQAAAEETAGEAKEETVSAPAAAPAKSLFG
jgi:secreted protein with Ig-like and vWFA domain